MRYLPVFLDVRDKPCLVVGSGALADEKARVLSKAGARVKQVQTLDSDEDHEAILIVAATEDPETAEAVRRFGELHRVFVNVVDKTEYCSFIVPAVVDRGNLLIAISTSGKSPAMASKIRRELEDRYGPEYSHVLELLGRIRPRVKASLNGFEQRKSFYLDLVSRDLPALYRRRGAAAVDRMIQHELGEMEK